jgi:hypothetical protein
VKILALGLLLVAAPAAAETWEVKIPERVELTQGTSGTLPIALAVDRGLTISKDGGVVIDLAPEGSLAVKKRRLGRTDAVDPDADAPRFSIPLRAEAAGDFSLKIRLRFWVCGQKVCRPVDARRSVVVAVAAPPADTAK